MSNGIEVRGIYRDPVRSSRSHFVKAGGLRWLSLMLLVAVPWAKRVWAFTEAGDLPVQYVARWNGETWHAPGSKSSPPD